jgi:dihydroorotate dehydrogenase electron transfer subunit
VIRNEKVAEETWWLELESSEIASASQPGQFLMIGFGLRNVAPPFLPRPFSVGWRSPDGHVGLLVREFGEGTRRLASMRNGDRVLLLGPLGNGFELVPGQPVLCLAGGVGLAPFIFLADEARRAGHDVRLVYGERTRSRVFSNELIESLTGGPVEVWTDDGSMGGTGNVVDGTGDPGSATILACGPTVMLTAVARMAEERGLRAQVSVEEHMACGVGTCQGCVVPATDGTWLKACTEGPVFDTADLQWPS